MMSTLSGSITPTPNLLAIDTAFSFGFSEPPSANQLSLRPKIVSCLQPIVRQFTGGQLNDQQALSLAKAALQHVPQSPKRRQLNEYFESFDRPREAYFCLQPELSTASDPFKAALARGAEVEALQLEQDLIVATGQTKSRLLQQRVNNALLTGSGDDNIVKQIYLRQLAHAVHMRDKHTVLLNLAWFATLGFGPADVEVTDSPLAASAWDCLQEAANISWLQQWTRNASNDNPFDAELLLRLYHDLSAADTPDAEQQEREFEGLERLLRNRQPKDAVRVLGMRSIGFARSTIQDSTRVDARHLLTFFPQLPHLRPGGGLAASQEDRTPPQQKEHRNRLRTSFKRRFSRTVIGQEDLRDGIANEYARFWDTREPGPLLLFVGYPGSGKTYLAEQIAAAATRNYTFAACTSGTQKDFFHGVGQQYRCPRPGIFAQCQLTESTERNVLILDEAGKMSPETQSVLLQALDPLVNQQHKDDFFQNIEFDLSHQCVILTANKDDKIIPPLLDRVRVFQFSALSESNVAKVAERLLRSKLPRFNGQAMTLTRSGMTALLHANAQGESLRGIKDDVETMASKILSWADLGGERPLFDTKTFYRAINPLSGEQPQDFVVEQLAIPGAAFRLTAPAAAAGAQTSWVVEHKAPNYFSVFLDTSGLTVFLEGGPPILRTLAVGCYTEAGTLGAYFVQRDASWLVVKERKEESLGIRIDARQFCNVESEEVPTAFGSAVTRTAGMRLRLAIIEASDCQQTTNANALSYFNKPWPCKSAGAADRG